MARGRAQPPLVQARDPVLCHARDGAGGEHHEHDRTRQGVARCRRPQRRHLLVVALQLGLGKLVPTRRQCQGAVTHLNDLVAQCSGSISLSLSLSLSLSIAIYPSIAIYLSISSMSY